MAYPRPLDQASQLSDLICMKSEHIFGSCHMAFWIDKDGSVAEILCQSLNDNNHVDRDERGKCKMSKHQIPM